MHFFFAKERSEVEVENPPCFFFYLSLFWMCVFFKSTFFKNEDARVLRWKGGKREETAKRSC